MKIITKAILDEQKIRELTHKHFPTIKLSKIEELCGGMFNSAYLLYGNGIFQEGVVLKVGAPETAEVLTYEKDLLYTEITVYKLLEGKAIKIPKLLAEDFSHDDINSDYFFMTKLEGRTWRETENIPQENIPSLMHYIGHCFAAIHSIKGDWFGYIKRGEDFKFKSWSDAFTSMMNNILEDGKKRNTELPYENISNVLKKHKALLDEIMEPTLVNYDLWAGNVLLKPDKENFTISGIIDFERAFFGDPFADFTTAVDLFEDIEQQPDVCAGYSEKSGKPLIITDSDRIRMKLYKLYYTVILDVETYRYEFEDNNVNQIRKAKVNAWFLAKINDLTKSLLN